MREAGTADTAADPVTGRADARRTSPRMLEYNWFLFDEPTLSVPVSGRATDTAGLPKI
jgi:hypothetical protein